MQNYDPTVGMGGHVVRIPAVEVTIEEREGYWAAYIHQFGTFVYADSVEEAMVLVQEATEDIIAAFAGPGGAQRLGAYLSRHGIEHTLDEVHAAPDPTSAREPTAPHPTDPSFRPEALTARGRIEAPLGR